MVTAQKPVLGVIGGSGVYHIPGLVNARFQTYQTPWGEPSDKLLCGDLNGQACVFLPRHGALHRIPPAEINYRANIDALKQAGVTDIISISAVGSLKEEMMPGDLVIVDQFINRTLHRPHSFFETGCTAHVSLAHPVCRTLGDLLERTTGKLKFKTHRGGTYVVIDGPQFSTKAESLMYRQMQADIIGMTNMPEAALAREAEICYATLAMVTDYDCWHEAHDAVTVESVLAVLKANTEKASAVIAAVAGEFAKSGQEPGQRSLCPHGCNTALTHAIMTPPEARDPAVLQKLKNIAGRVL